MLLLSLLSAGLVAAQSRQSFVLSPGQVFNMRAVAPGNARVDKKLLIVYGDSTLGVADPFNKDARVFHGVYMSEHGLILQPEPLQCVKQNYQSVLMVNDSLYSPSTNVRVQGNRLSFSTPVHICPSLNNVLIQQGPTAPSCPDAVPVELELVRSVVDANLL